MKTRTYLVSFSEEIGIKSPGTRKALQELAVRNFLSRATAAGLFVETKAFSGRLLMKGPPELKALLLSHFGFGKVAEFYELSPNDLLSSTFLEEILPERPFTYVVYVDRVKPKSRFQEVLNLKSTLLAKLAEESQRRLLSVWDNFPPERLEIRLEARDHKIFVLMNPKVGVSGLPVGSGERVLILFSGGPDSLLAALLLARRGQEVALLFMDDGEEGRWEAVQQAASELAYFFPGMSLDLYRLSYREILEFLSSKTPKRERCFFCKATMLKLATELARREGFSAVATGEIIGEQASQTLPALRFTSAVVAGLVLRPLLTFNKEEVFQQLERVGLGEVARRSLPPCPFVPDHPHTRPVSSATAVDRIWPKIKNRVKQPERVKVCRGGLYG